MGEVSERPAEVAGQQVVQLAGRRREAVDDPGLVQKDGGDARALEQVLEVVLGLLQRTVCALDLFLGGLELLVGRL
jgi:hypothetical protein